MRRAKIVCTLGPATDSYDQLKALVDAGMDVARFNLSHGTHAEHEERYQRVRKASDETGRSVGLLATFKARRSDSAASPKAPYSLNAETPSPSPSGRRRRGRPPHLRHDVLGPRGRRHPR